MAKPLDQILGRNSSRTSTGAPPRQEGGGSSLDSQKKTMETQTPKIDRAFILKAIQEARKEAERFTKAYLEQIGGDNYPCGFAWVNIKPARGPWIKALKDIDFGRTDDFYGGYTIWNPSGVSCQNVDAKIAGAKAFSAVLAKYGVTANVRSRWD